MLKYLRDNKCKSLESKSFPRLLIRQAMQYRRSLCSGSLLSAVI